MSYVLRVIGLLSVVLLSPSVAFAASGLLADRAVEERWSDVADLPRQQIVVPSVLEYALPADFSVQSVGVFDITDGYFKQNLLLDRHTRHLVVSRGTTPFTALVDENTGTFEEFPVSGSGGEEYVALRVDAARPFSSSYLTFDVDANGALPEYASLSVINSDGGHTRVFYRKQVTGKTISFLSNTSAHWEIEFWYRQPLRLTEIKFGGDEATGEPYRAVRFLAQPKHDYRVYVSQRHSVPVGTDSSSDLSSDYGVVKVSGVITPHPNPYFVEPDTDSDGFVDSRDNCSSVANPDQSDVDGNAVGDACDDFDRDGFINTIDNCRDIPNRMQQDKDGDKIGDECDDYDNRFTERNKWVPWLGIGAAIFVLLILFFLLWKHPITPESSEGESTGPQV